MACAFVRKPSATVEGLPRPLANNDYGPNTLGTTSRVSPDRWPCFSRTSEGAFLPTQKSQLSRNGTSPPPPIHLFGGRKQGSLLVLIGDFWSIREHLDLTVCLGAVHPPRMQVRKASLQIQVCASFLSGYQN